MLPGSDTLPSTLLVGLEENPPSSAQSRGSLTFIEDGWRRDNPRPGIGWRKRGPIGPIGCETTDALCMRRARTGCTSETKSGINRAAVHGDSELSLTTRGAWSEPVSYVRTGFVPTARLDRAKQTFYRYIAGKNALIFSFHEGWRERILKRDQLMSNVVADGPESFVLGQSHALHHAMPRETRE